MNNFVISEGKEFFSIFKRIKNRDFSGNSGIAIRNTVYQFAYNFVSKIGSLIFTVILARILMPELFGLYSLALSTIIILSLFTDLGAGQTLVRFISGEISKKRTSKARAYAIYLFKLKFILTSGVLILFLLLAKPLSEYYQKPIFLILLSGCLYLFSISIASFLQSFFHALNDFKTNFIRESLFQLMRLIIIPVLVLYFISKAISGEKILVFIFVCFGILWVILALFLLIKIKKTPVFSAKKIKLALKEKKQVNSFFVSLVLFSIFSIIFSYTDILLLGGFVSLEYIGYYQVAMGLVGSLSTLVLFSGSLFPVFSSMKGDALESGFNRTLKITFIISFVMCAGVLLFSKVIIEMLYGQAYLQAVPFFRELCLLLILLPFTSLYGAYFIAKGKPEIIKNLLIFVSLFNLGLNFLVVYFFSQYSYSYAVFGLISGTVFSNIIYLIGCILKKNKSF